MFFIRLFLIRRILLSIFRAEVWKILRRSGKFSGAIGSYVGDEANLVPPHGGVLVFLHLRAETVEFGCDCCVRLRDLFFERLVPAKGNQGRDDYKFSQ